MSNLSIEYKKVRGGPEKKVLKTIKVELIKQENIKTNAKKVVHNTRQNITPRLKRQILFLCSFDHQNKKKMLKVLQKT